MPKVFNKRNGVPEGAVYVGRPSKWGNPYVIGRNGDRAEVIKLFRRYLTTRTDLDLEELRGRDLVCWCAPLPCHADVLLEMANRDGTS